MIRCTSDSVYNFQHALRGMRNPLDSWELSDSQFGDRMVLGEKDLRLAKQLRKAGSDHRKFLRQILVSVDIQAPLYWWKEFDTYKVATVANSTSTMHTIHKKGIDEELFSIEHVSGMGREILKVYLDYLEELRRNYNEEKQKEVWDELIQLLPSSFNQLRTVTLNYETLLGIYHARQHHKLQEWHDFCDWILTLPYFKEICLED